MLISLIRQNIARLQKTATSQGVPKCSSTELNNEQAATDLQRKHIQLRSSGMPIDWKLCMFLSGYKTFDMA